MTVATLLVLALAFALFRSLTTPRGDPVLAALLAEADELRSASDSCAAALPGQEERFRAYDQMVDSLRRVVREFETPGGTRRTVPAADFDEYLAAFDAYNAAVPVWHAQADTLRQQWEACRALAERHNSVIEDAAARRYAPAAVP
jgi:hypothetical protein